MCYDIKAQLETKVVVRNVMGMFMQLRKSYRFALLVPVVLSGYTVALLLFNAKATEFNEPSVKLYITLFLSLLLRRTEVL